ncbi:hypothetical protein LCGC14_2716790 [marine sediment metagenome]|uniref:Methyltransferase type 11 domain-containing protein n=1 Tax=marine sediment metagenome TaxID=412755 RepID=A0A0F8ZB77_9ZZZZ
MAKAQNEADAHKHMTRQYANDNLSGQFKGWVKDKNDGLRWIEQRWQMVDRRMEVFEAGMGDATHLREWPAFIYGRINYTGVDFVREVVDAMAERFPSEQSKNTYGLLNFSDIPEEFGGTQFDTVLLLDVLYHIPSDDVYQALLDWAFTHARKYVFMTHATNLSQKFDGAAGPGASGYCWFPRIPELPDGWKIVWQRTANTMQSQRGIILERE